jgi:hypothetical protein
MTTTFRLQPGELNESFLEKLRAMFRDHELEVVVHETDDETGADYPFDNPAQAGFLDQEIRHFENGGEMVRMTLNELRSLA